MKKFVCRCGLWMVILALAAGIFYLLWGGKNQDLGREGTLVKNIREIGQELKRA